MDEKMTFIERDAINPYRFRTRNVAGALLIFAVMFWLAFGWYLAATAHAATGDGTIDVTEECDDGNAANGDGCSSTMVVEPDYRCVAAPSVCTYVAPRFHQSVALPIVLSILVFALVAFL